MTTHRRWLIALLAANAVAFLCLTLPGRDKDASGPVVVPFEMLPSNHMVVQAKVNGKGPFPFIFDLGAPVTLLGNAAAEKAGVVDDDDPKSFLFGMRGEFDVETLQLGDLKAEKVPVLVLDHPFINVMARAFKKPLAGIIG